MSGDQYTYRSIDRVPRTGAGGDGNLCSINEDLEKSVLER